MREIIFRTWCKRTGKFIDNCVLFGSDGVAIDEDLLDWSFDWEPDIELMQYTGLSDKNGKNIYEGDLLKNKSGRIAVVIWHDLAAQFDCEVVVIASGDNCDGFKNIHWGRYIEVIGNIYENPELIKEGKE